MVLLQTMQRFSTQTTMAIHSTFLGSTKVTGEDAKSFARKLTHARGTKAAAASAASGLKMMPSFKKKGIVVVKLNPKAAAK